MEKINVLAVDDRRENLIAIEALLARDDIDLHLACSGQEALSLMLDIEFAVVLLDVQMPEMDGFEVAELMRNNQQTRFTPIIFITAISKEEKHVFKGYESGAVDYIFKPLEPEILRSKVNVFLELYRQKVSLKENIEALKLVNQQLLKQQKAKIEEERLKTLFQMAGATAHELNQPLMGLLGNVELMRMSIGDEAAMERCVGNVEGSARRIADIVKKIQTLQQDRVRPHDHGTEITDIHQTVRILYVEDDDACFGTLFRFMQGTRFHLECASSIRDAFGMLEDGEYHIILLDYFLPDGNGIDFMVKIESAGVNIPVVAITNAEDEMIATKMIQHGASDYLSKMEVTPDALTRAFQNSLEKAALKREVIAVQQRMADLAFTDELTGVFNRRYLLEALQREIAVAERYRNEMAVCIFDLDHFKRVNDTHGHLVGDRVLAETSQRLSEALRKSDILGRYGGEEFVVVFPNTSADAAEKICNRFRRNIAGRVIEHDGREIQVTVSVGIAGYRGEDTTETMLERADRALYQAKAAGRNFVVVG